MKRPNRDSTEPPAPAMEVPGNMIKTLVSTTEPLDGTMLHETF